MLPRFSFVLAPAPLVGSVCFLEAPNRDKEVIERLFRKLLRFSSDFEVVRSGVADFDLHSLGVFPPPYRFRLLSQVLVNKLVRLRLF